MTLPRLILGLTYSDRAAPLIENAVTSARFDHSVVVDAPGPLFARMLRGTAIDACEMSLATYTIRRSRGADDLTALPIFPSRGFPHHTLYARRPGPALVGIHSIGAPEYQMTAAVWAREILRDELGIPVSVPWYTGALEAESRAERIPLRASVGRAVRAITEGRSLVGMLVAGELDVLVSPMDLRVRGIADAPIERLLPDAADREIAYYERTGVFPILHTVVVRTELLRERPWLAGELCALFAAARDLALRRLERLDTYAASLAWLPAALDLQRRLLGERPWPYGVDENGRALSAFLAACERQELLDRPLTIDELFAPSDEDPIPAPARPRDGEASSAPTTAMRRKTP